MNIKEGPVGRAVELVLQPFQRKKGVAVSVFAGPMSFIAGGPNLSRSTSYGLVHTTR